jgi:hypothetical protein
VIFRLLLGVHHFFFQVNWGRLVRYYLTLIHSSKSALIVLEISNKQRNVNQEGRYLYFINVIVINNKSIYLFIFFLNCCCKGIC